MSKYEYPQLKRIRSTKVGTMQLRVRRSSVGEYNVERWVRKLTTQRIRYAPYFYIRIAVFA
jgi:hypothetical protein